MDQPLPPDIEQLIEQLKSPDSGFRKLTAAGPAELDRRDERVRLALETAALGDPDEFVRSEARYALRKLGYPVAPPADTFPLETHEHGPAIASHAAIPEPPEAFVANPASEFREGEPEDPLIAALPPLDPADKEVSFWRRFQAIIPVMSPKQVEWVEYGLFYGFIIAFVFISLMNNGRFTIRQFTDNIGALIIGFFICAIGMVALFPYLVPVRCNCPRCDGRMVPSWSMDASGFGLTFECDTCHEIYYSNFLSSGRGRPM